MIRLKNIKFILTASFISLQAFAQGGGMDGGGGDELYSSAAGRAWIRFDFPVCVQLEGGAGNLKKRADASLRATISSTLLEWRDYLLKKKIPLFEENALKNLQIQFSEKCDSANNVIHFYFGSLVGTTHEKVEIDYPSRFAMAFANQYPTESKGGEGIVWIKRIPGGESGFDSEAFQSVLMHEIGHALGNGHISKTIMDAEFFHELITSAYFSKDFYTIPLSSIDREHELYLCSECNIDQPGNMGPDLTQNQKTFKTLTGEDGGTEFESKLLLAGTKLPKLLIKIRDRGRGSVYPSESIQTGSLELSSNNQTSFFGLSFNLAQASYRCDATQVFHLWIKEGHAMNREFSHCSMSVIGTLTSSSGAQWTVILERNLTSEPPSADGDEVDSLASKLYHTINWFDQSPVKIYLILGAEKIPLSSGQARN